MKIIFILVLLLCSAAHAGDQVFTAKQWAALFDNPVYRNAYALEYESGLSFFIRSYPSKDFDDYRAYVLFGDPVAIDGDRLEILAGTDCSHFVQRVFWICGFKVPFYKTRKMISFARGEFSEPGQYYDLVDESEARRGDLVFWEKNDLGRGHVEFVVDWSERRTFGARIKGIREKEWSGRVMHVRGFLRPKTVMKCPVSAPVLDSDGFLTGEWKIKTTLDQVSPPEARQ